MQQTQQIELRQFVQEAVIGGQIGDAALDDQPGRKIAHICEPEQRRLARSAADDQIERIDAQFLTSGSLPEIGFQSFGIDGVLIRSHPPGWRALYLVHARNG